MLKPGDWARRAFIYDTYTGQSPAGAWHLVAEEHRLGVSFACGRGAGDLEEGDFETTSTKPDRECGSCLVSGRYDYVMRRKEAGDFEGGDDE